MFTVEELFSKRNQERAFAHFATKRDGRGADGMRVSELEEYWKLNQERIKEEVRAGIYQPSVIKTHEVVKKNGKKRIISNLAVIDRFLTRLLAQKLQRYIEVDFLPHSYAYQDGKGILEAVMCAQEYMKQGKTLVAEIDLKDYFDTIPLKRMEKLLEEKISDEAVLKLIQGYLYCRIECNNRIQEKRVGLIQGNSISPVLSNLYLHSLDCYFEEQGYRWSRFADNIYIFGDSRNELIEVYNTVCQRLNSEYRLKINTNKSGVYEAINRRMLGYEFYKKSAGIEVRKYSYAPTSKFSNWHPSVLEKVNNEYHILQDGVLNKQDYSLLFENDKERHHIPVEVIDHMNMYGDVTITSAVLKTISENNIRLAFFDKFGNLEGYFVPQGYTSASQSMLKQALLYNDKERHLRVAKAMEVASIHNMRSNLRYYNKKNRSTELQSGISLLSKYIDDINAGKKIEDLLLIEARARQKYYSLFNIILQDDDFAFVKRTRMPPEDPLNALISFGNTLLYNFFLQVIWKSPLDPRIGMVHAANKRSHSLNLDFADIFKPVIVDRVIFSVINMHQVKADEDFETSPKGGIYLNKQGRKTFIEQFEQKLASTLVIEGNSYTYKQLMQREVTQFQKHVMNDEKYKPYKYY